MEARAINKPVNVVIKPLKVLEALMAVHYSVIGTKVLEICFAQINDDYYNYYNKKNGGNNRLLAALAPEYKYKVPNIFTIPVKALGEYLNYKNTDDTYKIAKRLTQEIFKDEVSGIRKDQKTGEIIETRNQVYFTNLNDEGVWCDVISGIAYSRENSQKSNEEAYIRVELSTFFCEWVSDLIYYSEISTMSTQGKKDYIFYELGEILKLKTQAAIGLYPYIVRYGKNPIVHKWSLEGDLKNSGQTYTFTHYFPMDDFRQIIGVKETVTMTKVREIVNKTITEIKEKTGYEISNIHYNRSYNSKTHRRTTTHILMTITPPQKEALNETLKKEFGLTKIEIQKIHKIKDDYNRTDNDLAVVIDDLRKYQKKREVKNVGGFIVDNLKERYNGKYESEICVIDTEIENMDITEVIEKAC